ncbi:MAG: hypothetical protein HKN33_08225 [Pyrinomonadaceae bacterium]|nr:hypothetical protein [Pyrinomonadaceae bacterium]
MRVVGILFLLIFAGFVYPQAEENRDVLIYTGYQSRSFGCFVKNEVVDVNRLNNLRKDRDCANFPVAEYIDFDKYSIVTYTMRGDCKISGSATITVDQSARLYTVHLSNYWGRCRSGGSLSGWLQISKIPEGYDVEFEENKIGGPPVKEGLSTQGLVESEESDLKGCVQLGLNDRKYISSESEYLAWIRKDAQAAPCKTMTGNLDFSKYAYFGINLNTGYCRRPDELDFRVREFGGSRNYLVAISYRKPVGICRALSQYQLWIRLPQTTQKYSTVVRIHRRK